MGKVGGQWSGKVKGSWFYSRLGDIGWVQDFIFCFWCWSTERSCRMSSNLSCMTRETEGLSLDLTQAAKHIGVWECVEFVISGSFMMKMLWLYYLNLEQVSEMCIGYVWCKVSYKNVNPSSHNTFFFFLKKKSLDL